jgi:hypothetical protein
MENSQRNNNRLTILEHKQKELDLKITELEAEILRLSRKS